MASMSFGDNNHGFQIGEFHGTINSNRLSSVSSAEKKSECQCELFITNPREDRKALKRKKGDHAPGTCEWILHTEELSIWLGIKPNINSQLAESSQFLWLHGNPGTGKSIMAIYLTEKLPGFLPESGDTLVYFFCESGFDTRKTATSVIRGLLYQIVERHEKALDYLVSKYQSRGPGLFTSFDALWEIFMTIAGDPTTGRKYIIIDALDECDQESQEMLLQQFEETFQSGNASPNIRLLVTSRPYPEIQESLQGFPNRSLASFPQRNNDINIFIDEKVKQLSKRKRYTEKVEEEVRRILQDKSEGTFLWIGLACEELRDIPSNAVVLTLQSVPKGLNSLYTKLLQTALEQSGVNVDDIRRLLSYVALSARPLTLLELAEACKLYEEEDIKTRVQFTREYIESCRLMVMTEGWDYVLLLHKSVKDFLVGHGPSYFIQELEAHAAIAYRCVDIVIDDFFERKHVVEGFERYAIDRWVGHARMAQSMFKVQPSQASFFGAYSPCRASWIRKADSMIPMNSPNSLLYIAARWGICPLVDHVLARGYDDRDHHDHDKLDFVDPVDVNCFNATGTTPLEYAAYSDYPDVFSTILRHGGEVNPQILIAAAGNGNCGKEIMAIIHDHFKDRVTISQNVLRAAAGNWSGGKEVLMFLFDRHGDRIIIDQKVVEVAATNFEIGNEIMKLFLDRRGDQIDVTAEVMEIAARNWDCGCEVVTLLLDHLLSKADSYKYMGIITEDVVIAAAENEKSGEQIMTLLLDRVGDQISITEEVVTTAAKNRTSGKSIMILLFNRRGDEIIISSETIKAAAHNPESGESIMRMFVDRCGRHIITDDILLCAIGATSDEKVLSLLLDSCKDQIIFTEGFLAAVAGNWFHGKRILELLLNRCGNQITPSITIEVVKAAFGNILKGEEIVGVLVRYYKDNIVIQKMVSDIEREIMPFK